MRHGSYVHGRRTTAWNFFVCIDFSPGRAANLNSFLYVRRKYRYPKLVHVRKVAFNICLKPMDKEVTYLEKHPNCTCVPLNEENKN